MEPGACRSLFYIQPRNTLILGTRMQSRAQPETVQPWSSRGEFVSGLQDNETEHLQKADRDRLDSACYRTHAKPLRPANFSSRSLFHTPGSNATREEYLSRDVGCDIWSMY